MNGETGALVRERAHRDLVFSLLTKDPLQVIHYQTRLLPVTVQSLQRMAKALSEQRRSCP
jgi:hypothetical protein